MAIWNEGRAPAALDAVGVLPWLDLSQPIAIGEVFVYPLAEGLLHVGERRPALEMHIGVYVPSWEGERAVYPSIVLHREQLASAAPMPQAEIRRAIDMLVAAAAYVDRHSFTNATLFQLYTHRFGAENTRALAVRRRNGTLYIGSPHIRVPRPAHAGVYGWHSTSLLGALVTALDHPERYNLYEALGWYRRASTDSDYTDREVDRVLLRTAVDWLVATPRTRANGGTDFSRVDALLAPFDLRQCDIVNGRPISHIRCALWTLSQDRNGTLHPHPIQRSRQYPFELQSRSTLDWLADRCFFTLLVARLVELQVLPLCAETRAFVEGVEQWLAEGAGANLGGIIRSRQPQPDIAPHDTEALSRYMDEVDRDLTDPVWEAAFFEALGGPSVDSRWLVNVYWRGENHGPVAQILEQLPRMLCGREVLAFSPDETAAAAAAQVLAWVRLQV